MNVLLVHLSDGHLGGGGGIAMLRLHLGLRAMGIDSKILCRAQTLDSPYVAQLPRPSRPEYWLKTITSSLGLNDIHLTSSFKVGRERFYLDADVVDFHGIHTRTLSYLALPALTKNKPAVFTMHDMWALTGHCAYSYDCERWKLGCGKCPYPETHPAIKRDNTRLEWRLKRWAYRHSSLAFAAPSKWLVKQARQSMIGQFPIHRIPYGIDTEVYRPLDPEVCRDDLGIAPGKRVLMFAALTLTNRRKGGDLLLRVLQDLPDSLKAETVLLTVGRGGDVIAREVDIPTIDLGYVSDERRKATAYSAADLFLCPTRADNLPLVLLESMSCGTPMVAFDVGGVSELVRSGVTGHLSAPESVQDFRDGVVQLLEDAPMRSYMSEQGRAIALGEYSSELQIRRYAQLYHRLLQNGRVQTESHEALRS